MTKLFTMTAFSGLVAMVIVAAMGSTAAVSANQNQADYEELARGPVHEAFAEQVQYDPVPGIVIDQEPPEPVPELPPDHRPEGENIYFLSGYWMFDDEREDFVWISGVYRKMPPGMTWVDGYWQPVEDGWQRVSGFYARADAEQVEYQPEPPATLETGPSSPAPSEHHVWAPGHWNYRSTGFVWRTGYWYEPREGWVWVPHYWRWTPRGCVLVGGYWDYPLQVRGQLFAPVYFHRPVYLTPQWHYTPRVVINVGRLHFHLFVRPRFCHYYFGDYYAPTYYSDYGYYPWSTYHSRWRYGCPIFSYNQWYYQRHHGINFYTYSNRWFDYYRAHPNYRPPRTHVAQQTFIQNNVNFTHINQTIITDSFNNYVQRGKSPVQWRHMQTDERRQMAQTIESQREVQRQRMRTEDLGTIISEARSRGAQEQVVAQLEQHRRSGIESGRRLAQGADLAAVVDRGAANRRVNPNELIQQVDGRWANGLRVPAGEAVPSGGVGDDLTRAARGRRGEREGSSAPGDDDTARGRGSDTAERVRPADVLDSVRGRSTGRPDGQFPARDQGRGTAERTLPERARSEIERIVPERERPQDALPLGRGDRRSESRGEDIQQRQEQPETRPTVPDTTRPGIPEGSRPALPFGRSGDAGQPSGIFPRAGTPDRSPPARAADRPPVLQPGSDLRQRGGAADSGPPQRQTVPRLLDLVPDRQQQPPAAQPSGPALRQQPSAPALRQQPSAPAQRQLPPVLQQRPQLRQSPPAVERQQAPPQAQRQPTPPPQRQSGGGWLQQRSSGPPPGVGSGGRDRGDRGSDRGADRGRGGRRGG